MPPRRSISQDDKSSFVGVVRVSRGAESSAPFTRSEREERKIICLSKKLEAERSDNRELRDQLRNIHFLIGSLKEELESKDSRLTQVEVDMEKLQRENRKLGRDLDRTYMGIETLVSRVGTVESQHKDLKQTHHQVVEEVKEARSTIGRLKRQIRASREAATEEDEERQLEVRQLKCRLDRANEEIKTLQNLLLVDNDVQKMLQKDAQMSFRRHLVIIREGIDGILAHHGEDPPREG